MKKKYIVLLSLCMFIVCLDQLTKFYIHSHYQLGESTTVIDGFFNITYVRNFGAAFGFLNDSPPVFREIFFLTMPPVALVVILLILRGIPESDTRQILALSSVFGGAVGNYVDRCRFRYVIDFLDFHWKDAYTYPAFNVADMTIVGGVLLLLFVMLMDSREGARKNAVLSQKD